MQIIEKSWKIMENHHGKLISKIIKFEIKEHISSKAKQSKQIQSINHNEKIKHAASKSQECQ